jgi:two-component system OmpR family sensor kinase
MGRRERAGAPASRANELRLRRLRWRLTALFAATFALGLSVLAVVVISTDGRLRSDRLDSSLLAQAQNADRRVTFDDQNRVRTESLVAESTWARAYPQVYVVTDQRPTVETVTATTVTSGPNTELTPDTAGLPPGPAPSDTAPSPPTSGPPIYMSAGHGLSYAFTPSRPLWPEIDVARIAKMAISRQRTVTTTVHTRHASARVLALPSDNVGNVNVAIVTIADPKPFESDHWRLVLIVLVGSGALLLTSTLAGFWLAGRSVQPAVEAIGQQERFLADAAHELRTPIAAMRAASESGLAGDESPADALARTERLAVEASALLDDLLTLARMDAHQQTVERAAVRLDLLVEELLDARHDDPPVSLHASPIVADVDAPLIRRAVDNLVANAVRHGRATDPTTGVDVIVSPGRITVSDRGPGIEPGILPHLFDRFRTGRHSGGAGLGLAIVAWIARSHGGKVTVESRPDGENGAVFTLLLPD